MFTPQDTGENLFTEEIMTAEQMQKMSEAVDAMKAIGETIATEQKQFGQALGDTKSTLTKVNERIDAIEKGEAVERAVTEFKAFQTATLDAMKELEKRFNRKGGAIDAPERTEHYEKFFKALRNGTPHEMFKIGLSPTEEKIMIAGADTSGGYLAPLEYVQMMIRDIVEYSPIRELAQVRSTSRSGIQIPKLTRNTVAKWVTEVGLRSAQQDPQFGLEEIRPHEMYGLVQISKQDLEDTVFDMEAFIRAQLSEQFGLLENRGFLSGTGVGQPEGILTNGSVASIDSIAVGELSADDFFALYFGLKDPYANQGKWLMNRSALHAARILTNGNGDYLWTPTGLGGNARPESILGAPVVTAPDMPAIGADTYPVIFGDFKRAYMIVDRVSMEVMVDPYKMKEYGVVEFSARKRVGGQVILPEAILKLHVKAS